MPICSMKREIIYTEKAPQPVGPYSQAIKIGDYIFLSGQIPLDPKTGEMVTSTFSEQCRRVLENIKIVLESCGAKLSHIVKVTVFLTDLSKFKEFNSIYIEYLGDVKPARSCVEVRALPKNAEIEMEVIAVITQ